MRQQINKSAYPEARIDDVEDTVNGVSFPDPYRWLEQNNEEVRRWQRAQACLASAHVKEWPHFEGLQRLVSHLSTERRVSLPQFAAGKWFRTCIAGGASQAQALVADEPMGEGRVLFDPAAEDAIRPPFLSWIAPSPDGRTLAIGVCTDGSESNTIRLIDVATGDSLTEPPRETLMDNWTGGVQWLPDSSGFFFSAINGPAIEFAQEVYLHRRTAVPTTQRIDIPWIAVKEWRMVVVSRDGEYAVAVERIRNPLPVAVARLADGDLKWRPFVRSVDGTVAGHVLGQAYIAVTDVGASRGRLVSIPLDGDNPNDPSTWRELLAESDAVLRTVVPVGQALYLTEFINTYARVRVIGQDGRQLGEVPLPGCGAISEQPFPFMNLPQKGHYSAKYLFAFSTLTVGWGIYTHTPGEKVIQTLQGPKVGLEDTVVEDRWAVSLDGSRVPYHLVVRADVDTSKPQPTLIYGYGGWNVPEPPQFPGPMAAFVAAGGVLVHAHLRGGSELGRQWWTSGRLHNKQNCYYDLYAIAEDLIAAGRATPQLLAVTGGSNGGLMAGVAATQRPELWKVVVARVPILDLIGMCREPYGLMCVLMEYADIRSSEEVHHLASRSPYQAIRHGTHYPAVFIDAGDTDPRSPPWHARKFAARLQKATSSEDPVLLHVWENVGHGWATDKKTAVSEHAEWLAFTLRHLGVELAPDRELGSCKR